MGRGGDKAARQDLFPTKVAEWQTEERVGSPPIGTGSAFDVVGHPIAAHLRALGALRDTNPALSTGASIMRLAQEGVLAISRIDRDARREYLAVFNAGEVPARVTVQTATPSATWDALLGGLSPRDERTRRPPHGHGARALHPPAPRWFRPSETRAREGDADGEARRDQLAAPRVRVCLNARPAERDVRGAARRVAELEPARSRRLGAVCRLSRPAPFPNGETVSLVAVVRASDGSVSTSPVLSVRLR